MNKWGQKVRGTFALGILFFLVLTISSEPSAYPQSRPDVRVPPEREAAGDRRPFIDTHNHLSRGLSRGGGFKGAAESAVRKMGELGIQKMIIMPSPFSPAHSKTFDIEELLFVVRAYPDRFALLGGGGLLNPMIHGAPGEKVVKPEMKERFRAKALQILSLGAVGFGELAAEHFSFAPHHPYESVPADHPLFLVLADTAAEKGVPLDIHMEAVTRDMALPGRSILERSGRNPARLRENISGLERLLSHNRRARIIWAHVGWCNTGGRTVTLCRDLLTRHPNLYMSFKLSPEGVPENSPLGTDGRSLKPEWLEMIQEFPDRFVIGTDQFYGPPGARPTGPQKTETTRLFVDLLPTDVARKLGLENPVQWFDFNRSP